MPSGIYIRTEQNKESISKARKKWMKKNPELARKYCVEGGKIMGGVAWKNEWKNKDNIEKLLERCSKAGKIGGKKGGKVTMQKQRKPHPSPIELIVRNFLDKLNVRHRNNIWFGRKEADIVIDKCKLIIECDGWTHRTMEKVKTNDKFKDKLFKKLGYKVLRLRGIEIRDGSFKENLEELLRKVY